MNLAITQVDAFTPTPFQGNPAAICLTDGPVDETWMKHLAREMNLSETAFLYPVGEQFSLRWLTPAIEVDLCGHATLAAAHTLWESGRLDPNQAALFRTRSGLLTATRGSDGWITLDFPAQPAKSSLESSVIEMLDQALGANAISASSNGVDLLVELESETVLRQLAPDFTALKRLGGRGVIVTARSDSGFDFVSRFFAPAAGIDEDPVTGSAHCFLGPFWAEKLGRNELLAYQASERGGVVRVSVKGNRVQLAGQAVTVLHATLVVAAGPPNLRVS